MASSEKHKKKKTKTAYLNESIHHNFFYKRINETKREKNAERQFIVIIFSTDITTKEYVPDFMKTMRTKKMSDLLMCGLLLSVCLKYRKRIEGHKYSSRLDSTVLMTIVNCRSVLFLF